MSATDHSDKEFLYITEKETPHCFKIYMKYPIEFTEAWVNSLMQKPLKSAVYTPLDDIFHDILFEKIAEAAVEDSVAERDDSNPAGIKPLRGHIRDERLTKEQMLKLGRTKNEQIAKLAEISGGEHFSGCHIVTDEIPLEFAVKARDMYRESQSSLLNSRSANNGESSCRVRIAMMMQIEPTEK